MENKIIYYSNTNNSKKIALYLSDFLGLEAIDINVNNLYNYNELVLVFPIHCQNIPKIVKDFLKKITVNKIVILATYGKMSYGNVLNEIQNKYKFNIVAAAYIPCKHSYIKDDLEFRDYEKLHFIKDVFLTNKKVKIKKSFKNPLANLFKKTRSKIGVKILKKGNCTDCGLCKCCRKNCIRCLKCVEQCPQKALDFKTTFFMSLYLKKKKVDKLIIYK